MTTRAGQVASAMRRASRLAAEWGGKGGDGDRRYVHYMPFNTGEFTGLLAQAVEGYEPGADEDVKFLGIGCGPGPELIIARDVFGLDATGIDRDPEYVAAACSLGYRAVLADAQTWPSYGKYQVLWFNRVARDEEIQRSVEAKVWHDAAPGAVVICANLEAPPPAGTFFPVLDDWEARRGIWMKAGKPVPGW